MWSEQENYFLNLSTSSLSLPSILVLPCPPPPKTSWRHGGVQKCYVQLLRMCTVQGISWAIKALKFILCFSLWTLCLIRDWIHLESGCCFLIFSSELSRANLQSQFQSKQPKLSWGEAEHFKGKVEKNMTTLDLFSTISSSSALVPKLHFVQKSKSFSVIGTTFHKGDHVSLGYLYALYSSGPPTFLAPRTGFMEDNFSMDQGGRVMVWRWFKHITFIVHSISIIITSVPPQITRS